MGRYRFVGECYVYGLEDATALLGPLGEHWRVQVFSESTYSRKYYQFLNTETGLLSDEDPRLPPMSAEWERTNS